ATVRLHFFRVSAWDGEPQPLEDQSIAWQRVVAPDVAPMLPANAPVLAALALPAVMVVSDAAGMGMHAVQNLLSRTLARVEPFGGRVVVNSDCGRFAQAHGVHLTSRALMEAASRPE